MKIINHLIILILTVTAGIILFLSSCIEEEKNWDTVLYEQGIFGASSGNTSIQAGESITFTDLSTKVYTREWIFVGGNPASSTDSVVTVMYSKGGSYTASLSVNYVDNQIRDTTFNVEVEGAILATYGIFTEDPNVTPGTDTRLEPNNAYTITTTTESPFEGEKAVHFAFNHTDTWGVMGTIKPYESSVDWSAFANGTYNVAIKTSCTKTMLIRLQSGEGGTQKAIITLDPETNSYGLERDGNWHFLSIPMADFLTNNPELDLTDITSLLVFRSSGAVVSASENWDFYVDHFYLEEGEE